MMVFKKKEVIAAARVVLIGMSGYLNWSYQDTVQVRDGDSYIETGKKLGEAQYVSTVEEVEEQNSETAEETASDEAQENEQVQPTAETVQQEGSEDYFEQARLDKEKSRSKSLEILNETAANESFDEEIRKKAGDKIILQAQNIEREAQIESIAQSKGYNEICVYIDEDRVNISVRKDGFSDADAVKLTEIATDNLKISSKNIKIVEVK